MTDFQSRSHRGGFIRQLGTFGIWLLMLLAMNGLQAAERVLLGGAATAPLAGRGDATTQGVLNSLRAVAKDGGTVRVIVGLRVPFAPQGLLSARDAETQRSEIATTREAVLSRLAAVAQRANAVRPFETVPFVGLTVNADEVDQLARMPEVSSIAPDELRAPNLGISLSQIGANAAASSGYGGAGQLVAVLDTGVDKNHPFLSGKVVLEGCYSSYDPASLVTSLCPGGATRTNDANSGLQCTNINGCDHGTHVAGIVAGRGGPAGSPTGVAPDAGIIAMQVFSRVDSSSACGGVAPCVLSYTSDQIAALERVLQLSSSYSIASVNMSLGGGQYSTESFCDSSNTSIKASIDNLRAVGIATVVASGNNGYTDSLNAPGCISTAVAVGATYARTGFGNTCLGHTLGTSLTDSVACFSNSATFLDLLAPGGAIQSSVFDSAYALKNGTSMAAPHVAGAWAVLKQRKPTATVSEVLSVLSISGTAVTDPRNGITKPRINLSAAVNAVPALAQHTLSVSTSGGGSVVSSPAGINCGGTCAAAFAHGASVTLTPSAAGGSSFIGWSGACSGLGACKVHMTQARSVTAQFSAAPYVSLTVSRTGTGNGTVTRTAGAIQCGDVCIEAVPTGSVVTLSATPASGHVFMGWSGGNCSGTSGCAFNAMSNATVTAQFAAPVENKANLLTQSALSGATNNQRFFSVTPPAGAKNLVIQMSGGTGDADLYVRAGSPPTTAAYDCRPYKDGNNEVCVFATPIPGATYHIMIYAYSAYSGVQLTVDYSLSSTPQQPVSSDITNVINLLLLLQSSP